MDRTAWIAVTLCVLALVGWQVYVTSHAPPPRPVLGKSSPAAASPSQSPDATPNPVAAGSPVASATPSPAAAAEFAEKRETLRNTDFEVHLTNRGGAVSDVVLLNHAAEKDQRVVMNPAARTPIAALVQDPAAIALDEFVPTAEPDGSVVYERKAPEGVVTTKHFFIPPPAEKKDNFLLRLDVDIRNDGAQPYNDPGYFVTLGSARPMHVNDWSAFTALAWSVNGTLKQVDVNWFSEQTVPIV